MNSSMPLRASDACCVSMHWVPFVTGPWILLEAMLLHSLTEGLGMHLISQVLALMNNSILLMFVLGSVSLM